MSNNTTARLKLKVTLLHKILPKDCRKISFHIKILPLWLLMINK